MTRIMQLRMYERAHGIERQFSERDAERPQEAPDWVQDLIGPVIELIREQEREVLSNGADNG